MWGAPEEPPDDKEVAGSSESVPEPPVNVKEACEDSKSQLETFKEIMLKNKNDLKKKEEELQEYASKLSEIKSRAKKSRRSKDAGSSSVETRAKYQGDANLAEIDKDTVDDISQAKTPKAKSSLLQRKLAENRKIFEQRNKEMTENKRVVEEKVEAIRQQMDQTDLSIVESQKESSIVIPVRPILIAPQNVSAPNIQTGLFQDKDNKVAELNNRILELEATVIDLQDNLKEKDSVIDSKTRAVTLMSADLSKRGKSTLDTLEDTKDEMRTMQENFVLIETSLKGKNDNLLEQLQERNERVGELEATIYKYEQEMEEKRSAESAIVSQSRTTIDTLADTKDAMRTMQENFILIETSLKEKIDNLLQQLQTRENKLVEAEEKIYKYESGAGVTTSPDIPDLRYKIERLEHSNRVLQDEKYELQKSVAELQEKIVARESMNGNGLIVEKDNRIAELENLIDELKNSNQLLEEESKAELQKQVDELTTRNDEFRSKIEKLEILNNDLEVERNELRAKLPDDSGTTKEDAMVKKLTKELEDSNKSMIKLKAQHKGKLRNLQKQLESFKMVSDVNAELVKLGNQVALLEEEKGNLQLSLVDFDELKASAADWQDRIADLESKVSMQSNDIQGHVEAIAILENQKLDLMQELHTMKQEISALEAENAESENLRVTAEMKVVDMEEQLESMHKLHNDDLKSEQVSEKSSEDLLKKIESLTQENSELIQKIAKFEEKASSEAGSTESFETISEDRNELVKRIEALSTRNNELEEKLAKLEETRRSNVGSTESFETINDIDKNELLRRIDSLSRENSDLHAKVNKFEEKGSSDTGSTESFEKIPEHVESSSRIDNLIRENNELVIKLTKLEEKLENVTAMSEKSENTNSRLENLIRENNELVIELTKVQEKMARMTDEKNESLEKNVVPAETENAKMDNLASRVESLTMENHELIIKFVKLEEKNVELRENLEKLIESEANLKKNLEENVEIDESATISVVSSLEAEIESSKKLIAEQNNLIEEMRIKLSDQEAELEKKIKLIGEYETNGISVEELQRELKESVGEMEEWKFKCNELEKRMEILEIGKASIEDGLRILQDEKKTWIEETRNKDEIVSSLKLELDDSIVKFANIMDEERALAVKQEQEIANLRESLASKEQELHEKYSTLQNEMIMIDSLQENLNDTRDQLKANEMIIVSLKEEIHRLRQESSISEEKISTVNTEIVILREELQTKAAKEARNEELVEQMKNVLNEQLRENENLRITLENSNSEIESLGKLLAVKDQELASLLEVKSILEEKIEQTTIAKNEVDEKLRSLQMNFNDSAKYTEDLKAELNDAYRMMELLKKKHTDDLEMQNSRLEDMINDINAQTSECEILRTELTEKTRLNVELESRIKDLEIALETLDNEAKRRAEDLRVRESEFEVCREQLIEKELLVGQNVTERVKNALEERVNELEAKLLESEGNTQAQLQKRKILAANLKKKSAQCEELEAKSAEFEAKVTEFQAKTVELEAIVAELQPKTAELEAKVAEIEPRAAELELKVLELGATAEEFKTRSAAFKARIEELEPKAANFEANAAEFSAKALENEAKALEFAAKTAELEEKIAEIIPRAAFFESKTAELEAKLAELEPKSVFFESKAAEFEAKLLELEPRATLFETEATELRLKSAEFEAKAAEFETKAAESKTRVSELEVKVAELEPKAAQMEINAAEFEEKWISEKNEKEAANTKIQEFEIKMQSKDETIKHLEEQVNSILTENSLVTQRAETLSTELHDSQQNINILTTRVTEMTEEIDKLRAEIENNSAELQTVRLEKDNLLADNEARRQSIIAEEEDRQQELDDAKEKARELGVRMQVMEAEYVEQLNTIQTQRTEIGMLASKHAQINERLENAEKESYERKILLDQIERERALVDTANENLAETSSHDDASRNVEKQSCGHCDQCQTVVQALEAKLQERDAEIENLDNELANSIGNFVHMRESLRVSDLMNQSGSRSRSHEDSSRDDLVFQYNALTASNAETLEKLNSTIHENQELREKIESFQALNIALQERTGAAEEELTGEHAVTRIHEIEATQLRLTEDLQRRNAELESARCELETTRQGHEEVMTGARSRIAELETRNAELLRNLEDITVSRNEAETQLATLRNEAERCQRRSLEIEAEFENYRRENVQGESKVAEHPTASSLFANAENVPQLFDAARVFGPSSITDNSGNREIAELRKILANKEAENSRLTHELNGLRDSIVSLENRLRETSERDARDLEDSRQRAENFEAELIDLRELLTERTRQIETLKAELNNVGAQLAEQFNDRGNNEAMEMTIGKLRMENERLANELHDRDTTMRNLIDEKVAITEKLANFELEARKSVISIDAVCSILDRIHQLFGDINIQDSPDERIFSMIAENLSMLEHDSPFLFSRFDQIEDSMKSWKNARNELLAELESCKREISSMAAELENSGTIVASLENRVESVVRERDIKQLQINDLTRSLEEIQEKMETSSFSEEIRLKNLQASLERALSENDELKNDLEVQTRNRETINPAQSEELKMIEASESEKPETLDIRETRISESGWDEEAKLDEDIWSWNPEDVQAVVGLTTTDSLLPSLERRLNARIAELEDTIKDLEAEREKLNDEAKTMLVRNSKLVKRLKEFKIQNENLRQQLKMQKATSELCDLDTAIEDELKGQILSLERALSEAKEETRKGYLERDNLSKRIDVLSSANERLVEMKEKQDMEVQVLQIRIKETTAKLQSMEWQFSESCGNEETKETQGTPSIDETTMTKRAEITSEPNKIVECFCKKYKEEIDELHGEMEALAAENEQMQKLLEEQRTARLSRESELAELSSLRTTEINDLSQRNDDLQREIDVIREDRRSTMESCEISEKDAQQRITDAVNRAESLRSEIIEKTKTFETEISDLRNEVTSANSLISELQEKLSVASTEKDELLSSAKNHEETREKLIAFGESMNELTDLLNARVQEVAELKREIQKLRTDKNAAIDNAEDVAQNHSREISMKNEENQRYITECEGRIDEQRIEIETLRQRLIEVEGKLADYHINSNNMRDEIERLNASLTENRSHRESLQSQLASKEQELFRDDDEVRKYALEIERLNEMVRHLQKSSADTIDETNRRIREVEDRENNLRRTMSELTSRESDALGQMYREVSEKDNQVANLRETVVKLEEKIQSITAECSREKHIDVTSESNEESLRKDEAVQAEMSELRKIVEDLRNELAQKNEKIEDYKFQLSESTYPAIIQALQDQVNVMYEERSKIEESLEKAHAELLKEREEKEIGNENTRFQSRQLKSMENEELLAESRSSFFNDERDVEIRNLRTEIDERAERFRDLHDRYELVNMELNELRLHLVAKENEILTMQRILRDNGREGERLRHALKGKLPNSEDTSQGESSSEDAREISSNELDIALYMLHQRDVRCEELTHELMQLLEERDTLQLRLSNAIRINEELRKTLPPEAENSEIIRRLGDLEPPLVEEPSPSKSVGPVEIAKEAIDSPTDEKIALAQKLSQLHNTGHRRDIRLMDDRDTRHNQQMSLLAHRDVLSTLPPEAAARIVNANYTLSRDVQSQSSILMNWLWGKSTPKVVHM